MTRVILTIFLTLIFGVSASAEDKPVMQREQATILLDEKESPKELEIKFTATVTATINVVEEINMLYRIPPSAEFNRIKLERDARLQYVATIPYADKIEYYFDIMPEKGPNHVVGSPTALFTLNSSELSRKAQNTNTGFGIGFNIGFNFETLMMLLLSSLMMMKRKDD
jgi:hypothetical protein